MSQGAGLHERTLLTRSQTHGLGTAEGGRLLSPWGFTAATRADKHGRGSVPSGLQPCRSREPGFLVVASFSHGLGGTSQHAKASGKTGLSFL